MYSNQLLRKWHLSSQSSGSKNWPLPRLPPDIRFCLSFQLVYYVYYVLTVLVSTVTCMVLVLRSSTQRKIDPHVLSSLRQNEYFVVSQLKKK